MKKNKFGYIEHKKIKLTNQQSEILTGLMLGDGCLELHKNGKNASLRITRQKTDEKYIYYHGNLFANFNVKINSYDYFDKRTNKTYSRITLTTKVNPTFTEWHKKWYPFNKKIVPNELILTPLVLSTWFADDGCVIIKPGRYALKLSTHGFLKKEVMFLKNQLKIKLKLNFKMRADNSSNKRHWFLVSEGKINVNKFIEIIKNNFPEGMDRKFNKWSDNKIILQEKKYPNCIYCCEKKVYKNGIDKDKKQKYKCTSCKKSFVVNKR